MATREELQQAREALYQQYLQGLKAKGLLEDFKEFHKSLKETLFLLWQASEQTEWAEIKGELDVLKRIELLLNNLSSTMTMAERQLSEIDKEIGEA